MVPETLFTIIGLGVSTVFIPMLSKIRYRILKRCLSLPIMWWTLNNYVIMHFF